MPVTSEVRLTKVFVITPATARRMPERLPIETSPETATLPAKVEVALLDVAMKLPLVVLGTTTQVGSVGGQLGLRVCPGR